MNPQPSSPARAKRNTIAPWGAVLFLLWSTGAFPQTAYERFRQAWDAEGTGQLQQLVQPGVKDVPPCVHLLTEAALACRLSDDRNALLLLDSLEQAACRTEWPIRAAGLKLRSSLLVKLGDPESGLVAADKGLGLLKGKPFPDERVDLMVIRSEALMVLDRFDDAMAQLVPAQRTVDSTGYGKGGALVHFSIGSIHFHQGRYSDAWQDFRAAYTLAGASGAHYLAMNALSNLAGTAIMQKDHTLALDLFDSVLQRPSGISPEVLAQARTQRGYIKERAGDHAGAVRDLEAAVAQWAAMGNAHLQVQAIQYLATSCWNLGRKEQAMGLLEQASELAKRAGQAQRRAEILRKLSRWSAEQGDPVKALEQLRAYSALSDSLAKAKYNEALAAKEVLFGTERKEHHIARQQQALELAAAVDRRKDVQRAALALAVLAASIVAFLFWRSLRHRRKLAEQERELHLRQVDDLIQRNEISIMNAMLEGQEKERSRMAKDLHDRLGAMLSTVKLQLAALEDKVALAKGDLRAHYDKVAHLLDEAVGEVRRIAHDMNSLTLSRFGLAKALEQLCDSVRVSGRLAVDLHLFGLERRMDRSLEIVLYRITQELISNALKHARAKEIEVSLTREAGRISLMVSDDGKGFNPAQVAAGMGLENVRSRVASFGGTIQIDSTPGHGTTVSVEGPVTE